MEDLHYKIIKEFEPICRYLDLSGEECQIATFMGISLLSFKEIKNKELEHCLQKFMIDKNQIPIYPVEDIMKNKLINTIFKF